LSHADSSFQPFRISAFLSAVGLAKEDQRFPSHLSKTLNLLRYVAQAK
jgi:hypothetical protein